MKNKFIEDLKNSNIIKNISEIIEKNNVVIIDGRVFLKNLFPDLFKNMELGDNNDERFQINIDYNGGECKFCLIITPPAISESCSFQLSIKNGELVLTEIIEAIRYIAEYNIDEDCRKILAYSIMHNCLCIATNEEELSSKHSKSSLKIKKRVTRTFDLKELSQTFDEPTIKKACSYFFDTLCEKIELDKDSKIFKATYLVEEIWD